MSKKTYTITIREEQEEWLKEKVQQEEFGSISHGVRYAVQQLMNEEEESK